MSSTLVLIDSAIENVALLASGVSSEATVVILDSTQDGVEQVSAILATQENLDSVHLFSHGAPGAIQLGASILSLDSIDSYNLEPWQQALRHANLLIYGCRVAAGEQGDRFLQTLHQRTGANIAATATPTGSATQGGDWNLERRIGAIDPAPILHPDVMAQYDSTLQQVGSGVNDNFLYGVSYTDANGNGFPDGNETSQLYRINLTNGNVALVASAPSLAFPTFAIARDRDEGNLFYIGTQANGSAPIASINPDTGQRFLSPNATNQPPVLFVKLAQAFGGDIYAMDGSTPTLYLIDIDDEGRPAGVSPLQTITPSDELPLVGGGGDIAFDPNIQDRLYVIVTNPSDTTPGLPPNTYRLYAVNTTNFTSDFIGNVRLPNGEILNDAGSGSLAFVNGALYLTSRGTDGINRLYRVDPNTAIVQGAGIAIEGNLEFNDFATLPVTVNNPPEDTPPPGTVDPDEEEPETPGDRVCVDGINRRGRQNRNNRILGDENNNRLIGANRVDFIRGYDCNDTLIGLQGRDRLRGGNGQDLLQGNQDDDRLNGGRGNDRLNGGLGNDTMLGSRGIDLLRGGNGDDRMFGGDGDDRLVGNQGNDYLEGGSNDDVLVGRLNRDELRGDDGNDRLRGNLGDDLIDGGAGNDLVDGGRGDDVMTGGGGDDQMFGRLGFDVMSGGVGDDLMNGQANADDIRGGVGFDRLIGRGGADLLIGGDQADLLNGGAGFDRLFGDDGNDRIIGGRLADQITTGRGSDRIIYRAAGDQGDRISDFAVRADQLDFEAIFAAGRGYSGNLFRQYVRIQQSGADTTISVDVNGNQRGGFQEFVTLAGVRANTVTRSNFIL